MSTYFSPFKRGGVYESDSLIFLILPSHSAALSVNRLSYVLCLSLNTDLLYLYVISTVLSNDVYLGSLTINIPFF